MQSLRTTAGDFLLPYMLFNGPSTLSERYSAQHKHKLTNLVATWPAQRPFTGLGPLLAPSPASTLIGPERPV
jgi:hypothetical protein